jgi:Type IV secretion system pilin
MIKRFLLSSLMLSGIFLGALALFPALANAQTAQDQILTGIDEACAGASCANETNDTLQNTVTSVINILSLVVGTVAVVMVIIGGMKYVSSQGDSSAIASAKNTIVYAVVGLVIVALAQVIVQFVVQRSNADPVQPRNNNVSEQPESCAPVDGVIPRACL